MARVVRAAPPPSQINANLTLGENIADNGGVRSSHAAWSAAGGPRIDRMLPGLPTYSPSQLFFVAYAQVGATRIVN